MKKLEAIVIVLAVACFLQGCRKRAIEEGPTIVPATEAAEESGAAGAEGVFSTEPDSSQPPVTRPDTGLYSNQQYGFTMVFPYNWAVEEEGQGTRVTAISPQEGTFDQVRETIQVLVVTLGERTAEADLLRATRASLQSLSASYWTVAKGTTRIDNRPANWAVYAWKQGDIEYRALQYHFRVGGYGIIINCTSPTETYDKYSKTFDTVAHTFRYEGTSTFYRRQ